MRRAIEQHKKGDTLIEVMLSISIFAMVAMIAINLMNTGINTIQRTLETEMARNEIDGQADAIRFIHNNYVAERNLDDAQYKKAWNKIMDFVLTPNQMADDTGSGVYFDINNMETCDDAYGANKHLANYKAFIVNPRLLIPSNVSNEASLHATNLNDDFTYLTRGYGALLNEMIVGYNATSNKFAAPSLYPRIFYDAFENNIAEDNRKLTDEGVIYNRLNRAEGIWVNAVGDNNNPSRTRKSNYFDFYIRVCWQSAGTRVPSTITTVVRLYNPEVME